MSYVPNFERRFYQVHPSQLAWAMHELGAVPGYNVQGYQPGAGGLYVIVVQVPAGAPQMDWRTAYTPAQRRPNTGLNWRRLAVVACVLAIATGAGYVVYSLLATPPAAPLVLAPGASPVDRIGAVAATAVRLAGAVVMIALLAGGAWVARRVAAKVRRT